MSQRLPKEHASLWRFAALILISIVLHMFGFMSWSYVRPFFMSQSPKKQLQQQPKQNIKQIDRSLLNKKIVDLLTPESKDKPKDADFLSDKSRVTPKQQQARIQSKKPRPKSQSKSKQQQKKTQAKTTPNWARYTLSDTILKQDLKRYTQIEKHSDSPNTKSNSASNPKNFLPNIDVGDETLLNTFEYKYASFYIRMKRQIEDVWTPNSIMKQYKIRKSTPYIRTGIEITLSAKGDVIQTRIKQRSGYPQLDKHAIESIQKAAPYHNPPKQLLGPNNTITIEQWGFIIH